MQKTNDRELMLKFAKMIKIESVCPLSIAEGMQSGELFVDNEENPTASGFRICGTHLWYVI